MAISKLEQVQLDVLDVLIEEGFWTGPDGKVLELLTQRIYGEDETVDSNNYHRVSIAVMRLEAHGLIEVSRKHHDRPRQANVIEEIWLA